MAWYGAKDNAYTPLAAPALTGASELVVTDATDLPTIGATYTSYRVLLWNPNTYSEPGDDPNAELHTVTTVVTNTLTLVGVLAHDHAAGERVANVLDAATYEALATAIDGKEATLSKGNLTATSPVTVSAAVQVIGGAAAISLDPSHFIYEQAASLVRTATAAKLLLAWTTVPDQYDTEADLSGAGHNATYENGSWSSGSRITKARSRTLSFEGTESYLSVADHADFSFVSGGADISFTIGAWIEVVDAGANQTIISKWDATTGGGQLREWQLFLLNTEQLQLSAYDESANANTNRRTDAGLSVGWHFVVAKSDVTAGSGATWGDGVTLYVDGVVVASTATNNGSYVAMEDLTTEVFIGAITDTNPAAFFAGDMGQIFVTPQALTDAQVWRLYLATRGYYGL